MLWDDALRQIEQEGFYGTFEEKKERVKSLMSSEAKKIASDAHRDYLNSPEWKTKRERVMKRDKYYCRDCLVFIPQIKKLFKDFIFEEIDFARRASQVHHLDYSFLNTPYEIDYCISLCEECHKKRHSTTSSSFNYWNKKRKEIILRIAHSIILKQEKITEIIFNHHKEFIKNITLPPLEFLKKECDKNGRNY